MAFGIPSGAGGQAARSKQLIQIRQLKAFPVPFSCLCLSTFLVSLCSLLLPLLGFLFSFALPLSIGAAERVYLLLVIYLLSAFGSKLSYVAASKDATETVRAIGAVPCALCPTQLQLVS